LTSLAQLVKAVDWKSGSNPAQGQFFAMIISCSRCSDSW